VRAELDALMGETVETVRSRSQAFFATYRLGAIAS
jgi:hypothetical protein